MSISLKVKLVAATLASVITIILLVTAIKIGSGNVGIKLQESQFAALALRNHTNIDMMHDAVRADVLAAFHAARTAPEQRPSHGGAYIRRTAPPDGCAGRATAASRCRRRSSRAARSQTITPNVSR
jgi:hypothetical protein